MGHGGRLQAVGIGMQVWESAIPRSSNKSCEGLRLRYAHMGNCAAATAPRFVYEVWGVSGDLHLLVPISLACSDGELDR